MRLNEKITDSNVLIACVILNIETVMASEKISYDNIKFLYVCPFLTDFMDGKIRVVENVPRYIFPLMSQRPFIKDGRAYLPLRLTFHILGYQLDWKDNDDNIVIYNDEEKILLNKATQKLNIGDKSYDMPLLLIKNSYYVPLRTLSEATGDTITWDKDTRTIIYVKNGSKLTKLPVIITDVKYELDEERSYEFATVYYTIKNISGETIPKKKLWSIVAERYTALRDEDIILRQL